VRRMVRSRRLPQAESQENGKEVGGGGRDPSPLKRDRMRQVGEVRQEQVSRPACVWCAATGRCVCVVV